MYGTVYPTQIHLHKAVVQISQKCIINLKRPTYQSVFLFVQHLKTLSHSTQYYNTSLPMPPTTDDNFYHFKNPQWLSSLNFLSFLSTKRHINVVNLWIHLNWNYHTESISRGEVDWILILCWFFRLLEGSWNLLLWYWYFSRNLYYFSTQVSFLINIIMYCFILW